MTFDRDHHLNENQLFRTVIDHADISRPLQEHLSACPQCHAEKESLEKKLALLGQLAKDYSPAPKRKVKLPSEKQLKPVWWVREWRYTLSAALTAIFIIFVSGGVDLFQNSNNERNDFYSQDVRKSEQFMAEISVLTENSLPQAYLDMTGEYDDEFSEEFLDFLLPAIDHKPLSNHFNKTGGVLC